MTKNCGNCKWYDPDYAPDDNPEDALGLCRYPAERIPYSLRYGNRERMAVCPLDGCNCYCFEEKES